MSEILKKLASVMFYAAIPLLIPFIYSLVIGDEGWIPIGITILILAFPAVPQIVMAMIENMVNFLKSLLKPETPFNYARIIDTETMKSQVESLTIGEVLTLTSVAWLVVPAIATIPYLYFGIEPLHAFFESMSGWTSTGLTAVESVDSMPQSLVLFRSITQWIGGLGIVVLVLLSVKGKEAVGILKAEGRSMPEVGAGETVKSTFNIYFWLTLIGIIALAGTGIDLFNSANLAFSGISNGGFFPFDSYEFTDSQQLILAIIMLAGATSFLFYKNIATGKIMKALTDEEFLSYMIVTAIAIALIVIFGGENIFNTTLNTISAIACGGFAIGDLGALHDFAKYLLILLMLTGGMIGSTTGGIKIWRILLIFKTIAIQIRAMFLPTGTVQAVKINNLAVQERTIVETTTFVFTYLLLVLAAAGAFIASGNATKDSLFMVASALGNVGLSTMTIDAIGSLGEAFLIILMYVGRIEIFPSLALIAYLTRR